MPALTSVEASARAAAPSAAEVLAQGQLQQKLRDGSITMAAKRQHQLLESSFCNVDCFGCWPGLPYWFCACSFHSKLSRVSGSTNKKTWAGRRGCRRGRFGGRRLQAHSDVSSLKGAVLCCLLCRVRLTDLLSSASCQ